MGGGGQERPALAAGALLTLVSLLLVGSERFLLLSMGLMLGCFYMQYRRERGRVA